MRRNLPTIGVWWKYMSISAKLVTHNRCVVALNGHLRCVVENYGQISYNRCGKWSYYDQMNL